MKQFAVDSNVFIYVLEEDPSFSKDSLYLLKSVEAGKVAGISSELVYLEVLSDSKLTSSNLVTSKDFLKATDVEYVPINLTILYLAAEMRRNFTSLKTPDAVHLATAVYKKAEYFVTNDKKLLSLKFEGVKIINISQAVKLIEDNP